MTRLTALAFILFVLFISRRMIKAGLAQKIDAIIMPGDTPYLTKEKDRKVRRRSLLLSMALYICSLTQVGFAVRSGSNSDNLGIFLVIFGTIGFTAGGAALSWLANPVLWFSWFMIHDVKPSFIASLIGTLLSLSFLFFDKVVATGGVGTDIMGSCGDCYDHIISYEPGYYLWLSSCLVLFIGNCIRVNAFRRLASWMKSRNKYRWLSPVGNRRK